MKIGTMMVMVALLHLGAAHAETVKPIPEFDRVGMLSGERQGLVGEPLAGGVSFRVAG